MEVDIFLEDNEPGVTVVEEDEGSAAPKILPTLMTFHYFLTFEEWEIMYLSASLEVVEVEIDEWGRGWGG